MNDKVVAIIRTAVPGAIGWLIAQAIAQQPAVADWIAYVNGVLADAGIPGTVETLLNAAAIGAVIGGYYALVRWLAKLPRVGPWIERLGLGSSRTPTYAPRFVEVDDVDRAPAASMTVKGPLVASGSIGTVSVVPVESYGDSLVSKAPPPSVAPRYVNVHAESDGFQLALDYGLALGKTREQVFAEYQTIIRGAD